MGAFTMIYLETNIRPGKDHESELLSQEGTARELDDYDEDVEESDEDNDEAFFENVSSRKGLITLDDSGLQIDFSKMSFNVTLQNHNHVLMLRLFFFFFYRYPHQLKTVYTSRFTADRNNQLSSLTPSLLTRNHVTLAHCSQASM
jgi:hypothetical protein